VQIGHQVDRYRELDGTNLGLARERDALCVLVEKAECELTLALGEARGHLGDANFILNQRFAAGEDPGHAVDIVALDDWASVVDELASQAQVLASVRLASAVSGVRTGRKDIDDHDALHAVDPARETLESLFARTLNSFGCRKSRYWLVR